MISTTTAMAAKVTAEEFLELVQRPENANKWLELDRGEVIEMPSPTKPHGFVCLNIGRLVANYTFEVGRFYAVGNDAGVILRRNPDTVRGPDIAVYDDAATFEELHPKYGEVAPLLAIEVLSPGDRMGKVMQKVREYLEARTRMVWVVDPEDKCIQIHRLGELPVVAWEADELSGYDVLPGFACKVVALFAFPKRPAPAPTDVPPAA